MNRPPLIRSTIRYLHVAGTLNVWFAGVFVLFASWIAYLRITGQRPSMSDYFFLFLVPFACGTGVLTAARRGDFDLLFGAGETRSRLWWIVFALGWAIPVLMGCAIMLLTSQPGHAVAIVRVIAVLTLTGGIAFSVGIVETRYFVGAVWILLRLAIFLSPSVFNTVKELEKGILPPPRSILLAVALAPETLLDPHMPSPYLIGSVFIGLLAVSISHVRFIHAELDGRRA